jgi:hypothetical protein
LSCQNVTRSRKNLEANFFKNQVRAAVLGIIDQFLASLIDLFIQRQFTLHASTGALGN